MKIIVERDRLRDALRVVASQAKNKIIPILSHVLLDASGSALRVVGHSLASCSQVTIPAEVSAVGSIAIPCDRLSSVVNGLPTGSQVSIDGDDKIGKVTCGRSAYQFSLLPPADFPGMLALSEPVTITLDSQQVKELFGRVEPCVCREQSRPYLEGIFLHPRGKKLAACATDGAVLALTTSDVAAPKMPGLIVPSDSCGEFVKVAGDDEATLYISPELVAISCGDRLFVSKVIDCTFIDYERIIPPGDIASITVDAKELDAALTRLVAVIDTADKASSDKIKLSWDANPQTIIASLQSGVAQGREEIECDVIGDRSAAGVILQAHYLRSLIEVTGGKTVRLLVGENGFPVRIEDPQNDKVVAVCMPCRF